MGLNASVGDLASEKIASWTRFDLFRTALETVGWQHFPTLEAELPEDEGTMPAASAAKALAELRHFTEQIAVGRNARLVDEDTGAELWTHAPSNGGVFALGPTYRIGIDFDGFFVRDPRTDPATELFRAMRLTQRAVETGVEFDDGRNRVTVARRPLAGTDDAPPTRLAVVVRTETPADYSSIVDALARIFRASADSGIPVKWF